MPPAGQSLFCPHWGPINSLSGGRDFIASMYPGFADWLAVHDALNGTGMFTNPFSSCVGITNSEFGRSQTAVVTP